MTGPSRNASRHFFAAAVILPIAKKYTGNRRSPAGSLF
jgi:hypothetical protein